MKGHWNTRAQAAQRWSLGSGTICAADTMHCRNTTFRVGKCKTNPNVQIQTAEFLASFSLMPVRFQRNVVSSWRWNESGTESHSKEEMFDCTEHVQQWRLKSLWPSHLVHTIQELQEDRCEAAALAAGTQVATLAELVAKGQPLFLQQHLKTLQSPIERIAQQLHQTYHLQGE